ncbi:Spy/CpxP family protein refolding chaperone [Cucumibacter marinus]|uniref:Spy/CpxP family protein refolding chaperone n=1 Tax=Cucumibacter marinus TaxID=1121252 RepID=UPI000413DBF4|nr:Spy/CpxP family protein refolding chaperone [Cucumibacter marinus]
MTLLKTFTLPLALAATMASTAVPMVAYAQETPDGTPVTQAHQMQRGQAVHRGDHQRGMRGGPEMRDGPGMRGGGPFSFTCEANGAMRVSAMIEHTGDRVELTPDQEPLLAALSDAALAAQADYAAVCAALNAEEPGDAVDNIRLRQSLGEARLTAVDSVLPAFEAFFDSLTDDQKAELAPNNHGLAHGHRGGDNDRGGPEQSGRRGS